MSAGSDNARAEQLVCRTLDGLAPLFRKAVQKSLVECSDEGLDAIVYESLRSDELQQLYFRRGRPPTPEYPETVTNAPTAQYGWHFFGLGVDVISASKRWSAGDEWNRQVATIFRVNGCSAGQDWPHPDVPHYQWGKCRRSPSSEARALYAQGGNAAVWAAVGAIA